MQLQFVLIDHILHTTSIPLSANVCIVEALALAAPNAKNVNGWMTIYMLELPECGCLQIAIADRPIANANENGWQGPIPLGHLTCFASLICDFASPTTADASLRAAVVVISERKHNAKVLVTRRASKGGSYNSLWCFPGGAVHHGESLVSAGIRETYEETGYLLPPTSSPTIFSAYETSSQNGRRYVICFYHVYIPEDVETSDEASLRLLTLQPNEVSAAAWIDIHVLTAIAERSVAEFPGGISTSTTEFLGVVDNNGGVIVTKFPLSCLVSREDTLQSRGQAPSGQLLGYAHRFALIAWQYYYKNTLKNG